MTSLRRVTSGTILLVTLGFAAAGVHADITDMRLTADEQALLSSMDPALTAECVAVAAELDADRKALDAARRALTERQH